MIPQGTKGGGILFRQSELSKPMYTISEVAKMLGVTAKTLQNYEKKGDIVFERTDGGHRRITNENLSKYLDSKGLLENDTWWERQDVVYARVSSHEQKTKGDLDRQVVEVVQGFPFLQKPIILKEVGSGLNDNRGQLNKLIDMVMRNEVNNVYINYKDRLTRFGFNYLERVFLCHGTQIKVLHETNKQEDISKALAEDMMSLIASFSGKLYGMRSHKKSRHLEDIDS